MTNQNFPIPQDALEQGLLASALSSQANWISLRQQFERSDFTSQQPVFNFIEEYLNNYSQLPNSQLIASRFQEWHPSLGDMSYWMTEMKRYVLARNVTAIIQDGFGKIGDPELAMNSIISQLSLIRSRQTNHIQAYDAGADERYEKYLLRNQNLYNSNKIIGIPTALKIIDNTKIGLTPSNMLGIYARPGVGKTWMMMRQAVVAWVNGYSVLVYSGEMSAAQLALRADVIVGASQGIFIDYNKLMIGHPEVQEDYRKVTNLLKDSNRWYLYDSIDNAPATVSDIAMLARQHKPDIILIDGISLMRAETRGAEWEKMKELSYGLKNLSTNYDVAMVVTSQAANSARGRRTEIQTLGRGDDFLMPTLNDAAYGDSFVQACSDVITMAGDPDSQYVTWYSIRKHRERGWQQALPLRMAFAWRPGFGQIIDLSELGYDRFQVGNESRRVLGLGQL